MRLTYFIFTLIFISSCNNYTYKSIAGEYQAKGGFESHTSINFFIDSTFIYDYQAGLLMGKSEGTWLLYGNKIILNSNKQPDKDSIIVIEKFVEGQKNIEISVADKNNVPIAAAVIILNNDTMNIKICDNDGKVKIEEDTKIDNLQIMYFGENYHYITNNEVFNKLIINVTFDPKYQTYRFFTNETWEIRNRNLEDNMNYLYKKVKRTTTQK
jgi:hypothetical protein